MDAKRKKELKELLISMKNEKLNEIKQNAEEMESIDSFQNDAGDAADSASNIYDKELHMDLSEKNKRLLNDIEEALKRLEDGKYGKCEKCGKDISIERLKILPFARLCIKCQASLSNKQIK